MTYRDKVDIVAALLAYHDAFTTRGQSPSTNHETRLKVALYNAHTLLRDLGKYTLEEVFEEFKEK